MAERRGWCSRLRRYFGHIQFILYTLSFFIGFFICVPIGILLRNFDGRCVLFAQLVWDTNIIYPWSETSCDYVLYMTVALCMFYSTFMGLFSLLVYIMPRHSNDDVKLETLHRRTSRFLQLAMNPVITVINIVITIMCLVAAVLVTVGFAAFCDDLEETMQEQGKDFKTCYEAKHLDWTQILVDGGGDTGVRGENFHICLTIATVGSWFLFVVWSLQAILSLSHTCRGFSCKVAAEKQRVNKSLLVAARRSRMQTPIGTPRPAGMGPAPGPSTYQPPQQQRLLQPPPQQRPPQPQLQQHPQYQQQQYAPPRQQYIQPMIHPPPKSG